MTSTAPAARSRAWLVTLVSVLVVAAAVVGLTMLRSPAQVPAGRAAPVVLLGVPGASWHGVDRQRTPQFLAIAAGGGVASLSVRTVTPSTCAADAWLTVSAGRRADAGCRAARVRVNPDGTASVLGWSALVARQRSTGYDARPGSLADAAHAAGLTVCAVGADAALAAAGGTGRVDRYWPRLPADLGSRCAVTLVAGTALDADTADLTDTLAVRGADTHVWVAGIADGLDESPPVRPGLRILAHVEVGLRVPTSPSWLSSSTTRWRGMTQLTDLTPTLLRYAGAGEPAELVGAPVVDAGRRAPGVGSMTDAARSMALVDDRARTGAVAGWTAFGIGGLLALAVFAWVPLRNRRGGSHAAGRGAVLAAAAFVGWVPLATYLTRFAPTVGFVGVAVQTVVTTLVLAAIGTAVLIVLLGRYPRHGAVLAVSTISVLTALVLGFDVLTGSHLQQATPFGNDPILGGRFYGIRNLAFAFLSTGVLVGGSALAALLAADRPPAGRRAVAVWVVLLVGVAGILADGLPAAGADVGGMLALTPGVVVSVLLLAGIRVTLLRLVAVLAAGVAVFVVVAALDLTRAPDQRSHIGRFAAQVLDGQAATVLGRKLEDNLTAAGPVWLTIVLSVLMLAVGALLAAPGPIGVRVRALRWPAERLTAIGARWPELRSGVLALLLTAVVAVLANDSGIVLAPAFVATLAPLLVMAGALTPRRPPARTNRATS